MKKNYSIPVNHFSKRLDLELHGLLNGFPALVLFAAAFTSYYLYTPSVAIGLVGVGVIWIILFVVVTYLYSNAILFVQEEGLILKKGKEKQLFKWEEIKALKFFRTKGGTEPTLPPIKLSIFTSDIKGEETIVYLYKNKFRTPLFTYYKLLGLIGCISQARTLLPGKLDKIYT